MGEGERPLRKAIDCAIKYLEGFNTESVNYPQTHTLEKLYSRFHLNFNYLNTILEGFRSVLRSVGPTLAEDEKLFHYIVDSSFVCMDRKAGQYLYPNI